MPSFIFKSFRVAAAAAALLASVVPLRLAAQEFSFYEPSPRAAALGGAFTARADDTTALFSNPAGLAFQGGFRIKADFAFAHRETTAAWPDTDSRYRTEPSEFTGSAGLSWQPIKHVTVATGLFSPYSYESYWTPGWPGETVVNRNHLRTLYFRSALAVEVFKGLALSAGIDIVSSDVWYRHYIPFNIPNYPQPRDIDIESSHSLDGDGLGFTAGILWKIMPALQIGARYQQEVAVDLAGTNLFIQPMDIAGTRVPAPGGGTIRVSDLIDLYYADQDVTGRMTLPREIAGGVAFTPVPKLSLYLDVQWDTWSGFGDWIFASTAEGDAINPAFTPEYREFYGLELDYGVQGVPLALRDAKMIKTGLEYRPAPHLAVRAGYARHQSTVDEAGRTPVYPDLDRNYYSLGFGYEGPLFSIYQDDERVSDLSFDVFLRYASAVPGPSAYPGLELTYESSRLTFGVGAGFIF
jgi:long-chain fatty acid transport protein